MKLFESSALMHVSAVKSLLSALCQLSSQTVPGSLTVTGQATNQQIGSVAFSIERMTSILVNNLHRKMTAMSSKTVQFFSIHAHSIYLFHSTSLINTICMKILPCE